MGENENSELGHCEETGEQCDWKRLYFQQMALISKAEKAILELAEKNKALLEETQEARKVRDGLWAKLSMAREEIASYLENGAGEEGGFPDVLAAIDGEVELEVVRVKVVEAEGYVCGLQWTDHTEHECMVGYGYSYWNLMRPRPEHGDEIVMLILRKGSK